MRQHEASRTLVKSPPELWAECSDADSLARHLDGFGEIRITRLEPESAVAWEGELVSGTVRLEPSGWGTRVILTAEPAAEEAVIAEEPAAVVKPEPIAPASEPESTAPASEPELIAPAPEPESTAPAPEPEPFIPPPRKETVLARLRRWLRGPELAESELIVLEPPQPESGPQSEPASPEPAPPEPDGETAAALTAALDSLGQAHHRPFSRA